MSPASFPLCSIPTESLIKCADILTPVIGAIINGSFHEGSVPTALKSRIETLLITTKKTGKDPPSLRQHPSYNEHQSSSKGHGRNRSHTISQKTISQAFDLSTAQKQRLSVSGTISLTLQTKELNLILIDMSAGFDTVHHTILLGCLQTDIGLMAQASAWFKSFLKDRSQKVRLENHYSEEKQLEWGVPQGAPLSFSISIQKNPSHSPKRMAYPLQILRG